MSDWLNSKQKPSKKFHFWAAIFFFKKWLISLKFRREHHHEKVSLRFWFYLKICSGTSKKTLQNMCLDKNDKSRCTSDFFIVTYVIPTKKIFVAAKTTGSILGFRGSICTFIWETYFIFLATAEVSGGLLPKVVAFFSIFHQFF